MINGLSGYGISAYTSAFSLYGTDRSAAQAAPGGSDSRKVSGAGGDDPRKVNGTDGPKGATECQTCKNRKYQDGSNENVSFKAAAHVSPTAAGSAVRAHEGEHVSNAYTKAAKDGGKVVRASVSIHTSVCPECGRTYVSGGTTDTAIKYSKDAREENPYVKNLRAQQAESMKGQFVDYLVS